MRLAPEDALALDRLALDLRAEVGRRVDRSEVIREAIALVLTDKSLQKRMTTNLERRNISRGGNIGLDL
jgi:Arc/MetJ-type ribon-helix-helix transcriptional regulator